MEYTDPIEFQTQFAETYSLHGIDPDLLRTAFSHSSYARENGWDASRSNQRLEFLGDAVLDVVLAEYLYAHYPELPEGDLTKMKAAAVRAQTLARIARRLELGRGLLLGRGEMETGGRDKPSLLADCVEAIIGAVYLSCPREVTKTFILALFGNALVEVDTAATATSFDHKTALQEMMQQETKLTPRYVSTGVYGPAHARIFTVEVQCAKCSVGRGAGPSKRAAQQAAAREALYTRDSWLPQVLREQLAQVSAPADASPDNSPDGAG